MDERIDVIVIGGGQAGLAMGYHLRESGLSFRILEGAAELGSAWRNRWDSLRLFTPAAYSALPGMAFPADPAHKPGKDEVARYLSAYARAFDLPVSLGERVLSVRAEAEGYRVETPRGAYVAAQVVVATGGFQAPHVPASSAGLDPHVVQLHSSEYRSAAQLPPGQVLVVGGGNSGVQIAAELAATHPTWLSVGTSLTRLPEDVFGRSLFHWLERAGFMDVTVDSRMGRHASRKEVLIGESPRRVARANGVRLLARAVSAEGNRVTTAAGERVEVSSVVWATGFRADYGWLDVPVLDRTGRPVHRRGVTGARGLYFLGLPWQHTRGSALLGWVARDAAYLADRIAESATRSGSARAAEDAVAVL